MAKGSPKDCPVYIDSGDISSLVYDIESYIVAYLDDLGIDHTKVPASIWAAALQDTYRKTFKRNKRALISGKAANVDYNIIAVSELLDEYIYLCCKYIQRTSVIHFSYLSGIRVSTLYSWKNDNRRVYIYNNGSGIDSVDCLEGLTISRMDVFQRLQQSELMTVTDLMLSRSGVQYIALFNDTKERLTARQDTGPALLDVSSLAAGLGISGDIRGLIGADSTKNQ